METEAGAGSLRQITFMELLQAGRLPSGYEFELMPDTVGIGLKVSEVDEKIAWRKKAKQAAIVTKSVAGQPIAEMKSKEQIEFFGGMLDTDVMFLSMAWTSQNNGATMKLADAGIPCPACGTAFKEIPYGHISVFCREQPVSGPTAVFPLEVSCRDDLPDSLKAGQFFVQDPNWMPSKVHIPENSWMIPEVVKVHRVLAGLRYSDRTSGPPRMLSRNAEALNLPVKAIEEVARQMDLHVPYMDRKFTITCAGCGQESEVPFDLGL
jgi:hypothetical protein